MCNSCARMKEDSWHIVAMDSAWREHRSLDENMSRSNTKCVGCGERTAVCIGPSATADGRLETDHRAAGRGSPVLRAMKNPSSHTSQASAFLSYLLFFFSIPASSQHFPPKTSSRKTGLCVSSVWHVSGFTEESIIFARSNTADLTHSTWAGRPLHICCVWTVGYISLAKHQRAS